MFAQGTAVVKLNPEESVVTIHGEGAVKWKIPGSVDYKSGRHPDSINRCPAGIPVVGSRGRSWRVLREDGV
mgnify:CR=1 FL=1